MKNLTQSRQRVYQIVTALQIGISCFSLLALCLVLPVVYNNVRTTIDYVENEMRFCEKSNYDAWLEVEQSRDQLKQQRANGTGRRMGRREAPEYASGYAAAGVNDPADNGGYADGGSADASVGQPIQTECPGCCIPGPPGPRGASGTPGKPGVPGGAGKPGIPGTSPNQTCSSNVLREPPPCRPCPKGPPGIKGWPGFPGDVGPIGAYGEKGRDGEDGATGEPGPKGPPGFKGSPGSPGDKGETPQGDVREGPPGDPGPLGPIGAPGVPGLPGRNGLTGPQGDRGWPGQPGEPGEPGYPGTEGVAGAQGPPGQPGSCVCQNVDSVILVGPGVQQRVSDQADQTYSGNSAGGYGGK